MFSRAELATTDKKVAGMKNVPKWEDWQQLWKLWDQFVLSLNSGSTELTSSITLTMCPEKMLHTKPIDLRHICLFYLGHMYVMCSILENTADVQSHLPRYLPDPPNRR
jgi:hypothetical protein